MDTKIVESKISEAHEYLEPHGTKSFLANSPEEAITKYEKVIAKVLECNGVDVVKSERCDPKFKHSVMIEIKQYSEKTRIFINLFVDSKKTDTYIIEVQRCCGCSIVTSNMLTIVKSVIDEENTIIDKDMFKVKILPKDDEFEIFNVDEYNDIFKSIVANINSKYQDVIDGGISYLESMCEDSKEIRNHIFNNTILTNDVKVNDELNKIKKKYSS